MRILGLSLKIVTDFEDKAAAEKYPRLEKTNWDLKTEALMKFQLLIPYLASELFFFSLSSP